MDCSVVILELAPYHLDMCDAETQAAIDAHLPTCAACVRAYLATKRALAQAPLERPRAHVRERLRAEVERTFRAPPGILRVANKKIPLYQGLGVALAAAALAVVLPRLVDARPAPVAEAGVYVDSARPQAENFTVY